MKKNLLLSAIIFQSLFASAQRFEWLTFATHGPSYPWAPDAVDPAGNIYALIGTGPSGAIIQNDTIPGLTAGDGVIIAKFGPTGNLLWGKMVSQDGGVMGTCDLAVDNSGAVYACTGFGNGGNVNMVDTVFSAGSGADAIIKLDSSGHFVRAKLIAGFRPQITCLGTDIYISADSYMEKLDSALNTVWVKSAPPGYLWFDGAGSGDIFSGANGELVASCGEGGGNGPVPFSNDSVYFSGPGYDEWAIVVMDTSGQLLWSRTLPSAGAVLQTVCFDSHGNVYVGMKNATIQYVFAGDTIINTLGGNGYCIAFKWDSAGTPMWGRGLYNTSLGQLLVLDMAVNAQDELLISGHAPANFSFNNDTLLSAQNSIFLIKVSPAGDFIWYKSNVLGFGNAAYADGIAVRNGNEYILTGATNNPATYQFGCISHTTASFINFVTFISENPEVDAAFTMIPIDAFTFAFNDQSIGTNLTWSWSFPGGTPSTSNVQNPTVVFSSPGSYTATLVVCDGICCDSDSIQILNVGVDELNSDGVNLTISPNPGSSELVVRSSETMTEIRILDVLGNEIYRERNLKTSDFKLQTSNFETGIYFVNAQVNGKPVMRKFVKE